MSEMYFRVIHIKDYILTSVSNFIIVDIMLLT